jgi:ribosomal protein S18 acetylase RimI-like enzyme
MSSALRIVPCSEPYWEFVRQLRTDPRTCQGFVQQVSITPAQQSSYMRQHAHCYLIALGPAGTPLGFVGVVDNDLRLCTHPDHQRKGVGSFMLREILKRFPMADVKVRVDNVASRQLFAAHGIAPALL